MTKMTTTSENYNKIRAGIVELLKTARTAAARNVNSIMTAVYWDIGRRIVEFEQGGEQRAEYGEQLIEQLSGDLTRQFGRGSVERIFGKCVRFTAPGRRQRFSRHCLENLQAPLIPIIRMAIPQKS